MVYEGERWGYSSHSPPLHRFSRLRNECDFQFPLRQTNSGRSPEEHGFQCKYIGFWGFIYFFSHGSWLARDRRALILFSVPETGYLHNCLSCLCEFTATYLALPLFNHKHTNRSKESFEKYTAVFDTDKEDLKTIFKKDKGHRQVIISLCYWKTCLQTKLKKASKITSQKCPRGCLYCPKQKDDDVCQHQHIRGIFLWQHICVTLACLKRGDKVTGILQVEPDTFNLWQKCHAVHEGGCRNVRDW